MANLTPTKLTNPQLAPEDVLERHLVNRLIDDAWLIKHYTRHQTVALTCVGLIPAAVELFRNGPELNNKVARKAYWLSFAAFFSPKPQQGRLVFAHNDPGVRAADEISAFRQFIS
jgi:hypothetical protein